VISIADERTTRGAGVVNRTLIVLCCLVFLWQTLSRPWGALAAGALGFTPGTFFSGGSSDPLLAWVPFSITPVTYLFLHAGFLHLAGNLLCLWVFGDDVEEVFGKPGFLVFFLGCGIAAALTQAAVEPMSRVPVVGASGAVSGVLGAYLLLHARAKLRVSVPVFIVFDLVRLPAWVVLVFWFGVQLAYDLAGPAAGGSIAFRAHIGGFIAGLLLTPVFRLIGRRQPLPA
jgi:membrane associated rhomboid family serine protease